MKPYDVKTALLGGIIDYAGTFPPAALSLDKALQRASKWREEGMHPWLYGRVALPLEDIKKISPRALYQSGADGSPWIFTVLGSPDTTEFLRCIEWDLREIRRCQERWTEGSLRMEIVGYETKLPATIDSVQLGSFLTPALDRFEKLTGGAITPYIEMSWEGDWESRLAGLAMTLGGWAEENAEGGVVPAIKVRTGGAFTPTPEQLAKVIVACVSNGLKFKATQGLHACLTHGKDLGFVSLLLSLALEQSLGVGVKEVAECLALSDPRDLKWEADSVTWKEFKFELDAIEAARRRHGGCFGSCSLDEPDESLTELFSENK